MLLWWWLLLLLLLLLPPPLRLNMEGAPAPPVAGPLFAKRPGDFGFAQFEPLPQRDNSWIHSVSRLAGSVRIVISLILS